jgi:type IV pilus assembly protein PilN
MIKINLLPVRAARKKENIRRQVSIFFLCLIFTLSVMAYVTISMSHKISNLKEDIEESTTELKKYEAIAKRVQQLKNDLKKLEAKMDIIVKLEANRAGPVLFMDALTQYVVPDKIWLTDLTENKGNMTLNGMATDNKTVADFMTNLESSDYFHKVDLVSSQQTKPAGNGRKYKKFSITCKLTKKNPERKQTTS